MTEIDFHVELYNAYLQPPGAEIDYLTRVRKKGEYSKGSFILNLEKAFNNLREAWENEFYFKQSRGLNPDSLIDFAFPMSALNRYPALSNFSKIHYGHISKVELEGLSKVLTLYKIQMKVRNLKKLIDEKTGEAQTEIPNNAKNELESIWMKNPSISLKDFLEKGNQMSLWDSKFNLIAKRNCPYGSGKTLLANLYIVLKNKSIDENIDHKKVGSAFCSFFKIELDPKTENPLKAFTQGNQKQINELKKRFK